LTANAAVCNSSSCRRLHDVTGGSGLFSYGDNQVTGNALNGCFTGTASFH
jgi:hypothetical protein